MHDPVLSPTHPIADYTCGSLTLRYILRSAQGAVELTLFPTARKADLVERRKVAPLHSSQAKDATKWALFDGDERPDSIVQLHLRGDALNKGFGAGHTMRHSASTENLRFLDQEAHRNDEGLKVITRLTSPKGLILMHEILWEKGRPGVMCCTSILHEGDTPVVLEHLSSFSLSKLSPFATDDMPERLRIHRFQSAWSLEGRHENRTLEDLHLERSWAGYGHVNLRFGQIGSMPVRGYFPFVGLEDTQTHILWGAQLVWHGSWQMEIHRQEDPITLAGSHGDYEFAQWSKTLNPGESFAAPPALLSCAEGDIDDLCQNLVGTQEMLSHPEPASELGMPILFNEWCSSWGNPTHDNVVATAKELQKTPTEIFVIDDGWAKRPGNDFQVNGDWIVNTDKFPHELKATTTALKELGITTGIWFEFEVVNVGNPAFSLTDHHLQRNGQTLQVGNRHFWDFRDPWTWDYLREKVIGLLRDNEFGYMKVDYNDSIGVGCDPVDDPNAGLGEGLRQHLVAVKEFFHEIRRTLPEMRIENCSSGGHRLEPGMVGLTTMSSFSDAHECVEIPIIAANLLRLIPARKNQIWVVLRPTDSLKRLKYGFAATFLGRMAVSGDLNALSADQRSVMDQAQACYKKVHAVIRDGVPRLFREETGPSYRNPTGRQAVRFHREEDGELLIVRHTFEHGPDRPQIIPLPPGTWTISTSFHTAQATVEDATLVIDPGEDFSADVFYLTQSL
jgi:alpha-galactosidase